MKIILKLNKFDVLKFTCIWNWIVLHVYKICLFLQPNIKYSIVGFSDSPDYFKIDENTGVISVKTDLRSDLSKRTTYLVSWFLSYQLFSTITAAIS